MTDLLSDLETPSDAELISRVRGGDVAAYGDLFSRHVDSANRLARQLVRGPDSDDLVSEAFAKVLQVLQGGGGPDVAFRAYLLTAVRRLHIDRVRAGAKVQASDDMEEFDPGVPFLDTAVAQFESGAAARAFATLPERWQLVLWHLEVEGQKPAEIAALLGMSANSVSALAYRAREGLRQAFLTMHLNDITETDCRWVNEHLGAYVRRGLSKRDTTKVQHHLDECRRCTAMYLELTEVNSNLRGIIAPVLLGAAATGYLSSTGAAGGLGLTAVIGRARDLVLANAGTATAGAVAAGVAAVATAGIVLLPSSSPERVMGADEPVVRTSPELSFPPSASPGARPSSTPSQSDEPSSLEETDAPGPTPAAGAAEPAVLLDEGTGTTSGPAALPGEPGVLPAPLPGNDGPAAPGPGTDPATDPGTGPGADPGAGPGTDPGTGPGTNPEPGPGPAPIVEPDPGTAPDPDPVPDPGPGPTNPGPTDPGPGDPTPDDGDVGTGGGDTGGDGGGGTGGDGGDGDGDGGGAVPDLLPSTLRVPTEDIIVTGGGDLTFPVQGDPALPSTLIVSMDSGDSGITFGDGSRCDVQQNRTTAVCPTTLGGGATFGPATADGGGNNNTYPVNLPLTIPPGLDSAALNISVSVPEGYDPQGNVDLPTINLADVALKVSSPEVEPEGDGNHVVNATVAGVPAGFNGSMEFVVDGASLVGTQTAGCEVSGAKLICAASVQDATFVLDADPLPAPVDITLAPLTDYFDHVPTNNTATAVLVQPQADAAVTAVLDEQGNSGTGTVVVDVAVDPDVPVNFTVGFDWNTVQVTAPGECRETNLGLDCALTGDASFELGLTLIDRAGNQTTSATLTFSVAVSSDYRDTNLVNNTAPPVTIDRFSDDGVGGDDATGGTESLLVASRSEGQPD